MLKASRGFVFKLKHKINWICFLTVLLVGLPAVLLARDLSIPRGKVSDEVPQEMQGVGITEKLGRKINLDLKFKNENGDLIPLSTYFDGKRPVLLSLVYYACPNLCNFHLNGITKTLKKMSWSLGNEFDMVVVSIDPSETPELAREKKKAYLESYGRENATGGWHFLTGTESSIHALADQVGFGYKWDERSRQWVHSAAAYVISPTATINRYLYGIDFSDKTLRLSLVEATNNKIGTLMDRVLLYCLHYDPVGRTYSFYIFGIVRVMAAFTAVTLILVLARFWWRQHRLNGTN